MKFTCDRCDAQYMISDEKVGPNGVKVRCKKCSHVILVRRAVENGAAAAEAPVTAPAPAAGRIGRGAGRGAGPGVRQRLRRRPRQGALAGSGPRRDPGGLARGGGRPGGAVRAARARGDRVVRGHRPGPGRAAAARRGPAQVGGRRHRPRLAGVAPGHGRLGRAHRGLRPVRVPRPDRSRRDAPAGAAGPASPGPPTVAVAAAEPRRMADVSWKPVGASALAALASEEIAEQSSEPQVRVQAGGERRVARGRPSRRRWGRSYRGHPAADQGARVDRRGADAEVHGRPGHRADPEEAELDPRAHLRDRAARPGAARRRWLRRLRAVPAPQARARRPGSGRGGRAHARTSPAARPGEARARARDRDACPGRDRIGPAHPGDRHACAAPGPAGNDRGRRPSHAAGGGQGTGEAQARARQAGRASPAPRRRRTSLRPGRSGSRRPSLRPDRRRSPPPRRRATTSWTSTRTATPRSTRRWAGRGAAGARSTCRPRQVAGMPSRSASRTPR